MKTDFSKESDEKLLEMTKINDLGAFETLVERYRERAYYLALRLVGDPSEARDVSQEAFIRVYHARKRYDQSRPFFSWFYTILSNLAKNRLKKNLVRERHRKSVQDEKQFGDDCSLSPDYILESSETRRQVWEAIEKLSFEQREIIVLRHFEDLSYEEIAEALGIPVGSVMSRLYYARLKLRDFLGGLND